jgi:hypothetical protein
LRTPAAATNRSPASRRALGRHSPAADQLWQAPHRGEHGRADIDRAELELRQQPEKPRHRPVALDQLSPPLGVIIAVIPIREQLLELLERDRHPYRS